MTINSSPFGSASTVPGQRLMSSGEKSAVTARRHKQERREERLRDIRAQVADGRLVIRHMTDEQHDVAGETARQARGRHEARRRRYQPLDH